MRTLVQALVVASSLSIVEAPCSRPDRSLEQTALDEFIAHDWAPELFDDECTGLQFNETASLNVYSRSPGFSIDLPGFGDLAPIDLRAAAMKKGGLEALAKQGVVDPRFGPIDLTAYRFARPSPSSAAREEWRSWDGYLVRFSNRIRFKDRIYLQLWIKGGYSSSGRRIDFQFDDFGRLLTSKKVHKTCDDWG